MPFNNKNIPACLQQLRQWLCWRKQLLKLKDGTCRIGKTPINPVAQRLLLGWQEERNWLTFTQATKYLEYEKCDGVGFVFSGKELYSAIDLDKCFEDGHIVEWAQEIVRQFDSYTEFSPSGLGLRIFVVGKPIGVTTKVKKSLGNGQAIEIFAGAGCYVTVTSNVIQKHDTIRENQSAIDWLIKRHFVKDEIVCHWLGAVTAIETSSDTNILKKARNAKNGSLFRALYDVGDISRYKSDASAADLALASLLSYWTNGDEEQIDRLFRGSALYRPEKWDKLHGKETYGQMTIIKATRKL